MHIVSGHPHQKTLNQNKDRLIEEGATSSIFILPFKYQIQALGQNRESSKNKVIYQPVDMQDKQMQWAERQRYFSRETACVLYEHARRYRVNYKSWLQSDNKQHPKIICFKPKDDNGESISTIYRVKIEAPEIILFENHDIDFKEKQIADNFKTGFLIIRTYFEPILNQPPPKYEHLLHFNERFRYWRPAFDEHYQQMQELHGLVDPDFLAKKQGGLEDEITELYLKRWQRFLEIPFAKNINGQECLYKLFPNEWSNRAEAWFRDEIRQKSTRRHKKGWILYNDTRAYVCTNAIINGGAHSLKKFNINKEITSEPEAFGHWVKLLNIDAISDNGWLTKDNEKSLNYTTEFERNWAKDRTYTRWAHFGTLYGFNYHSFVSLSGPCSEPPISKTFRRHYLDMILLLLYLRITIFRFSDQMNRLTIPAMHNKYYYEDKFWEDKFRKLRKDFAFFTNLYQFPLISNQQQMLEMYQYARKHLDIDELFKEVEDEIKNTHEYFSMESSRDLNEAMANLSKWGLRITLFALPIGLLSISKENYEILLYSLKQFFNGIFY
ncbi:MAG TPA: hypothetical protein ENJ28_02740 [Gammaproteobacteria bacterium]|nr:hypothetical protein [Gammaproteobacteria bacterium]